MSQDDDRVVVDLAARKTEPAWQSAWDSFWLRAAPLWFDVLGWLLIVGALSYLSSRTGSVAVAVIARLSAVFIWQYLTAFFFRFQFLNIPWLKSPRTQHLASLVVSGALAAAATLFAFHVAADVAVAP